MADHIIKLPDHFIYLDQFAPSPYAEKPSLYRCVAASVAMLMEIAWPGRYIPAQLEDQFYVKYGGPDVATDTNGISKESVLQFLQGNGTGFVDLAAHLGDHGTLKAIMQRQNDMGIPHLITVADESFLRSALTDAKLHNWADQGLSHTFVRVGYSDDQGYGYYLEPAAPGFVQPIPISWDASIEPARVITVIAIMPAHVHQPPADFDWLHETWPIPPAPLPDYEAIEADMVAFKAQLEQERAASDVRLTKILAELAAH